MATAALLPINGDLLAIPLGLCIITGLLAGPRLKLWLGSPLTVLLAVFYLLHVIGMAWTSDVDFGLFDLQVKASLVLLPLAVSAWRSPQAFRWTMIALTAGLCAAFVLGLWFAVQCLIAHGWIECWTQSYLSPLVHPSYQAWYAIWCLGWWALDRTVLTGRPRVLRAIAMAVLLVYALMLASKAGLITLGVLGVLLAARWARGRRAFSWRMALPLLAGLVVVGVVLGPVMWHRVRSGWEAVSAWRSNGIEAAAQINEGSGERLVTWSCSVELLKQAPFGAGTGDIKHALFGCYDAHGATFAKERQLNSHSQFLQGGVALGWPGLVLVLSIAFVPLVQAVRRRRMDLLWFALLFVINATVESVLEVQGGVLFVGLFAGLLACWERSSPPIR